MSVSVFLEHTFATRQKGRDPPLPPAPFNLNIAHAQITLKMGENLTNASKMTTESRRRPPDRKSTKTNKEIDEEKSFTGGRLPSEVHVNLVQTSTHYLHSHFSISYSQPLRLLLLSWLFFLKLSY